MQLGGGGVTTGPIFRIKFWDKMRGRGGGGGGDGRGREERLGGETGNPEAHKISSGNDFRQTQIREGTQREGGSTNRRGEIVKRE